MSAVFAAVRVAPVLRSSRQERERNAATIASPVPDALEDDTLMSSA